MSKSQTINTFQSMRLDGRHIKMEEVRKIVLVGHCMAGDKESIKIYKQLTKSPKIQRMQILARY